ncbi:class I SAM-dependent DNA methyltransferase [Microvirga sp. GCM10011540]|uniref:class I SAM-dependent DNA methyltransferase n=1 Tax=Microvirga sp. GCM10011540 TaxID=3317338 RepID=UPI0036220462
MTDQPPFGEPIARRAYSAFADRYAALAPTKPHNGLYERPATMALLGEVRDLHVLDAGCGPGIYSEALAREGATVHGFDITPEMIDLARRRCDGLAATFRTGDLARPLAWLQDGAFDKVVCALALDYMEDLAAVFREFRRVTRPGGILVFSMSHPMADWTNEKIRGDGVYFERARYGLHWTGFGEPHPYVEAYRRPLSETLNALSDAGWTFYRLVEPQPLPEMRQVSERIFDRLSRAPEFICVRARR